jgi:hypothetical protein
MFRGAPERVAFEATWIGIARGGTKTRRRCPSPTCSSTSRDFALFELTARDMSRAAMPPCGRSQPRRGRRSRLSRRLGNLRVVLVRELASRSRSRPASTRIRPRPPAGAAGAMADRRDAGVAVGVGPTAAAGARWRALAPACAMAPSLARTAARRHPHKETGPPVRGAHARPPQRFAVSKIVTRSADAGFTTLFEQPLVLFRDGTGTAFALLDRCSHRNTPLSRGAMDAAGRIAPIRLALRRPRRLPRDPAWAGDTSVGRRFLLSPPASRTASQAWGRADAEAAGKPPCIPHAEDRDISWSSASTEARSTPLSNAPDALHGVRARATSAARRAARSRPCAAASWRHRGGVTGELRSPAPPPMPKGGRSSQH